MMFLFNWVIFRFHVKFQGCEVVLQTPEITRIFVCRDIFRGMANHNFPTSGIRNECTLLSQQVCTANLQI